MTKSVFDTSDFTAHFFDNNDRFLAHDKDFLRLLLSPLTVKVMHQASRRSSSLDEPGVSFVYIVSPEMTILFIISGETLKTGKQAGNADVLFTSEQHQNNIRKGITGQVSLCLK